jgi:hypothetical protein
MQDRTIKPLPVEMRALHVEEPVGGVAGLRDHHSTLTGRP